MTEKTVQVPVSLIEDILDSAEFTDVLGHIKEPLRALLSQPNPSAESDIDQWHREQDARLARMRALDRSGGLSTIRDIKAPE